MADAGMQSFLDARKINMAELGKTASTGSSAKQQRELAKTASVSTRILSD